MKKPIEMESKFPGHCRYCLQPIEKGDTDGLDQDGWQGLLIPQPVLG